MTRFTGNRKIRLDRGEPKALTEQPIAETGTIVWLPGYGEVKVFQTVAPNGDATHWETNDLGLDETGKLVFAELSRSVDRTLLSPSNKL